ncbi:MAG: ABC transporter ATP-binding protein [Acidimicrobiaceae bacterium]|nr:ABC transporter ATP-binding protein [Acidimicrobiaceae bacterium]MDE0494245.1 ABC transporter ATP-binding protein [Acidimicrobiaceae bacterium]MDE0667088.1 ABC transporter ATP-binding protein [Acidimicrobiaceae bacterium]MXY11963.1 ABC transporter ATP-binding protein [Acidimicrobiaceae bacterium]MXZ65171.1 ABC transporter ATP-binding protein [Acidimicrobiaceae bacterium]
MNGPGADSVLLQARGVTKRFPGVVANDDITLEVHRARVHCLLGENGAGKSTLADLFYGVHEPDEGVVELRGEPIHMVSPRDAIAAGIGMVRQHFELVTPMSVLENVVIGTRGEAKVDLRAARERLGELCDLYGVEMDLDTPVGDLAVGQQQWVEILKALYLGCEVLILDEPTAVLTPEGIERLFATLRRMASEGLTIVLITHKLHEVMEISDDVTVLRRGRVVRTSLTSEVTMADLTRMMVGRDVDLAIDVAETSRGDLVLDVSGLDVATESGRGSLKQVSLQVHEREILGIAGVSGNGQDALFDVLVGMSSADGGRILVDAKDVAELSPADRLEIGIASVPADRIHQGLMMDFRISENLILGRQRSGRYRRRGWLNQTSIAKFADESVTDFEIAAPSPAHVTRVLSGGNLQKIVMARELAGQPRLLIVHQPTRGLDIGATEYVRRRLVEERDRGAAILLISEDLDELLNLSSRIAVMFDGRIVGEVDRRDATIDRIGMWMAGVSGVPGEALA